MSGSPLVTRLSDKLVIAPDGCWHWTGALSWNGYPLLWLSETGRNGRAHRLMYELIVGPIADGLDLDHLCRNRRCVNPAHLEPVTRAENLRRAPRFSNATATDCDRGHLLTPENTRVEANGYRRCRACDRELRRERRAVARGDLTSRKGQEPCVV